ncbi:molecular chaperone HscC [Streptococcus sp. S784/96/1]|uniref:molecular chaperone HscC n=1 Tax=Streptococcus sp. S784/96/1 TaxID=2653499 RepID=UPI001389A559|nr:molecular chaperone HscC [Streptococcus sp. S784/96/1]
MILGIDLGTTNSLAAVWRNGKVELIPNHFGEYLTPSAVGLSDEGELIVGKLAKERLITHPQSTQSRFKRFMGTQKKLRLGDKEYLAEELSSFVLRKLIEDAESYLGETVEEIVVSVPAYFNDEQRAATKVAGQLAGVKIDRIINEPSAAALALHRKRQEDATYLIIDFGGGTLDISIVDAFLNVIEIVTVAGDNHLGGEDFTQAIVDDFYSAWPTVRADISAEESAQLYQEAEKVKQTLDKEETASFRLMVGKEWFSYHLTQERFLAISKPLLNRIQKPIRRALRDAELTVEDVDDVILVGGNTKMPLIQNYLSYLLKRSVRIEVNQDQAIALGCGVLTGIKARNEDIKDMVLTDICPFTLGIEIVGDVMSPILERNAVLPSSKVGTYYTTQLGQTEIKLTILQGEEYRASNNIRLGTLDVQVPLNHKEYESIDVRFSYDINGILEVDVIVNSTGATYQKVFLRDNKQLSQEEIAERREHLASLKSHPKDQEVVQLLLSRGQRLFSDSTGNDRDFLTGCIRHYEEILETQDLRKIKKGTELFKRQLDAVEERIWGGGNGF